MHMESRKVARMKLFTETQWRHGCRGQTCTQHRKQRTNWESSVDISTLQRKTESSWEAAV